MVQLHISQLDIQQAVSQRIEQIAVEIQELQIDGVEPGVTAQDLFNLEALGLVLDFATGMVSSECELPIVTEVVAMS